MTALNQILKILGLTQRSFKIKSTNRPDISEKRTPPRSMTPAEKDWYTIHKNLNGFYSKL